MCFLNAGYDEDLIKKINSGKVVEVDKIHPDAKELVKQIKKSESK